MSTPPVEGIPLVLYYGPDSAAVLDAWPDDPLAPRGLDAVGDVDPDPETGSTGGFYVADDGPGIAPEDREDVFDSGFSTSDEGTGLGLSIVRTIAEATAGTSPSPKARAAGRASSSRRSSAPPDCRRCRERRNGEGTGGETAVRRVGYRSAPSNRR